MSVYKLPYLYCDGPGCVREDYSDGTPFVVDPLPGDTAASTRESAKAQGWIHSGGKDYCPICAEARRTRTSKGAKA